MSSHSVSPPRELEEQLFLAPGQIPPALAGDATFGDTRGGRRGQRKRNAFLGVLPAAAIGVVALGIWQILAQTGAVLALFLPAPAEVLRSWWLLLISPNDSLAGYAAVTMLESLLGCALGMAVAIPLGYGISHSRLVASAAQPYLAASQALPIVAIAPLIALWLSYGLAPEIIICALIVFFPMVITTVLGLRLVDGDIVDAARVAGANRWALLRYIELPLALPSVLAGLRASLTLSVTGAVVGEFVIGGKGLGVLLIVEMQNGNSAAEFATLFTLAGLAALLYGTVRIIERRVSYAEGVSTP